MGKVKPPAIKPNFFENVRSLYINKNAEKINKAGIDKDDQFLQEGKDTNFWKVLKAHIEELKEGLDTQMQQGVISGMSDEEVGKRAVILVLAKGLLDSIINKVEDTAEVVTELLDEQK